MQTKPTILIILGVTGDLTAKKIIPALFNLFKKQALPAQFKLVGFGRREFTPVSFRDFVRDILAQHFKDESLNSLNTFLDMLVYHQGLFEDMNSYAALNQTLKTIQKPWGAKTNRLFYLAVPPGLYETIFNNLKASGLGEQPDHSEVETRILVEKPFGSNLQTAEKLDQLLANLYREENIYRIDHYLAKEMVQNILTFRFSNDLFEKTWSSEFIEKIEIRLWETLGVEHRGSFYDGVGALRDVGQNHLLQMLALMAMDYPLDFSSKAIQLRRAQILKDLEIPSPEQIKKESYRAQYRGYQKITGVDPKSETETYFKIQARLSHPRWIGVPFIMEGGKRLHKQHKEIAVTFKHPENCLCPAGGVHYKNRIIFSLEPFEEIYIEFWSKKPGLTLALEKRTFNFLLRQASERRQYVEEYEKLLLDCILGDQTLFVSTHEVKSMWRFIDPIISAWNNNLVTLETYKPDTNEPIEGSA